MQLEHVSLFTESRTRPDTNLMEHIPGDDRILVCRTIIGNLSDGEEFEKFITPSTSHLRFYLEFIGSSFAFPISEFATIERSLKIARYLLENSYRISTFNEAREENLAFLMQTMTQVFNYRKDNANAHRWEDLCLLTISNYGYINNQEPDFLDAGTQILCLHTLIGVADYFVTVIGGAAGKSLPKSKIHKDESILEVLTTLILKTIFDFVFTYRIRDPALWDFLGKFVKTKWNQERVFVRYWTAILESVSENMVRIVTGTFNPDANQIIVKTPEIGYLSPAQISVPDRNLTIFFFWRVLNLLDDVHKITDNSVSLIVISGLRNSVETFLRVGRTEDLSEASISTLSANPILKIFGTSLVKILSFAKDELVVARTFGILCRIIVRTQRAAPDSGWMNMFISSVVNALRERRAEIIFEILKSTERIFINRIDDSVYVLIPEYLETIKFILAPSNLDTLVKMYDGEMDRVNSLMRSSLLIVKSLISLSGTRPKISIPKLGGKNSPSAASRFDFTQEIKSILYAGITAVRSAENLNLAISCFRYYVVEALKTHMNTVPLMILHLVKFITKPEKFFDTKKIDWLSEEELFSSKRWGLHVLRQLAPRYDDIHKCSSQTIPLVVSNLCRYVEEVVPRLSHVKEQTPDILYRFVAESIITVSDFTVPFGWLRKYPSATSDVFSMLSVVFSLDFYELTKQDKTIKKLIDRKGKLETQEPLGNLSAYADLFPEFSETMMLGKGHPISRIGVGLVYAVARELFYKLLTWMENPEILNLYPPVSVDEKYIKEEILGGKETRDIVVWSQDRRRIMSFIESEGVVYCVVRGTFGKSFWRFEFQPLSKKYLEQGSSIVSPPYAGDSYPPVVFPVLRSKAESGGRKGQFLSENVSIRDKLKIGEVELMLEAQTRESLIDHYTMLLFRKQKEALEKSASEASEASDAGSNDEYHNSTRLLLENIAILGIYKLGYAKLLDSMCLDELARLDSEDYKYRQSVPVICIDTLERMCVSDGIEHIVKMVNGIDTDFSEFLHRIGWWKDGGLRNENYAERVDYEVLSLMEDREQRAAAVKDATVVLVWCSVEYSLKEQFSCRVFNKDSSGGKVYVVVRPHFSGLFHISVETFGVEVEPEYVAGLQDLLVSRINVGDIVHQYVASLTKRVSEFEIGYYIQESGRRAAELTRVANTFVRDLDYSEFFSEFL